MKKNVFGGPEISTYLQLLLFCSCFVFKQQALFEVFVNKEIGSIKPGKSV